MKQLVFVLQGGTPQQQYERVVTPAKPSIGLQPEEIISVVYRYSDGVICSDTPAKIVVTVITDEEHFDGEQKKLDAAIKHKAKPISNEELEESQKPVALLTMMGYVNKEIGLMLNKSSDAVRKCRERIFARYGIPDHELVARYFLKKILKLKRYGISTGWPDVPRTSSMSQKGRLGKTKRR
ncbi:MAG: helix-turn-helix transcriptional regulator [Bacteroidia bacterium]